MPDEPTPPDTIVPVPDPAAAPPATPPAAGDPPPPPDGLPEKFKTVEALVSSYTELEKKMSSMTRAPEVYELNIPEGVELDQKILDGFKVSQLTQEQAQSVVDMYIKDILPSFVTVSKELELQKLSNQLGLSVDKGTEEAQRVLAWAQTQVGGNELVKEFGTTAAGTLYLREKMLAAVQADRITDVPGHPSPASQGAQLTAVEIDRMVSDPRYDTDPAYRSMVMERVQKSWEAEANAANLA